MVVFLLETILRIQDQHLRSICPQLYRRAEDCSLDQCCQCPRLSKVPAAAARSSPEGPVVYSPPHTYKDGGFTWRCGMNQSVRSLEPVLLDPVLSCYITSEPIITNHPCQHVQNTHRIAWYHFIKSNHDTVYDWLLLLLEDTTFTTPHHKVHSLDPLRRVCDIINTDITNEANVLWLNASLLPVTLKGKQQFEKVLVNPADMCCVHEAADDVWAGRKWPDVGVYQSNKGSCYVSYHLGPVLSQNGPKLNVKVSKGRPAEFIFYNHL